jgi:hypothetical protein
LWLNGHLANVYHCVKRRHVQRVRWITACKIASGIADYQIQRLVRLIACSRAVCDSVIAKDSQHTIAAIRNSRAVRKVRVRTRFCMDSAVNDNWDYLLISP